jgi:hypothetical protein
MQPDLTTSSFPAATENEARTPTLEHDRGNGIQDLGAVMLADTEHVDSYAVRDLLEEVGHAAGHRRERGFAEAGEDHVAMKLSAF